MPRQIKLSYTSRSYAPKAFLTLIEKRLRKFIRAHKLIDIKKTYFLLDDGTWLAELTEYYLQTIFHNRLALKKVKKKPVNSKLAIILPWSLEHELADQWGTLSAGKGIKKHSPKTIKLLQPILEEELRLVTFLKKIHGEELQFPKIELVEAMQEKFPETKFSMFKTIQYIQEHSK